MRGPVAVRPLEGGDREACLGIFDSNVPDAFRPEERGEFERFLDEPPGPVLRLETIPDTVGFFRHLGFEVVREEPDGYGPGLPRVELRRPLRHEELP